MLRLTGDCFLPYTCFYNSKIYEKYTFLLQFFIKTEDTSETISYRSLVFLIDKQ